MKAIDYFTALAKRNGVADIDCQAVLDEENENLAEQSHKEDTDINTIVRRIEKGVPLDPFSTRTNGVYGDFTQYQDYQQNLNTVIQAQEAFDSLRAEVRKRFDNDPAQLMKFLDDEKNREEAIQLGLLEPKKEPAVPTSSPKSIPKSSKTVQDKSPKESPSDAE